MSLLPVALILSFAGCGGGSTTNVHNPAGQASSTVSIAFQPAPTGSILLNSNATLTAVVSKDSSNSGVDWSLPCPTGTNCGTLTPLHTDSGKAVSYTPPPTVSGNSQTFKILAFAAADHTRNVVTPMTVTGFAGNLKGTYVIQTSGVDAGGAYQFAGVIVLDGNAGITSGEQTINAYNPTTGISTSVSDTITGGTYLLGPDGRGTLTINTTDQNIGQLGIESFSLAFLSSAQALVAKIDFPDSQGTTATETSVGTLDLQTSKAAPTGGYAFAVNGTDIFLQPMTLGGVFNIDSPHTISGSGSVADQDDAGTVFPKATLSGTVSDPDSFGAIKFDLTAAFASTPIQFTGYIVDGMHIKLIESDSSISGAGFGETAGVAIGQGAATGTFKGKQAFSGTYVFGILGEDLSSFGTPSSLASAGIFTADGSGHLTNGFDDEYLGIVGAPTSDSFLGTYAVDPSGTGRVRSSIHFHDRNNPRSELIFYLTGNGNPPLILDEDPVNFVYLGAGAAYPAASQVSFTGDYGLSFTQNNGTESDSSGVITVAGSAQTLSGTVDSNFSFSPLPDTALTGSFQTTTMANRLTGTLSNQTLPNGGPIAVAFYMIDPGHGFFVETDFVNTGNLAFGYFATRTPVCQGCP